MSCNSFQFGVGQSLLERLPTELLCKILIFVTLNPSPDRSSQTPSMMQSELQAPPYSNFTTLMNSLLESSRINDTIQLAKTCLPCLLTSRTLHMTALPVMYRDVTTYEPLTFSKFVAQVRCYPQLGMLVRSLDLSPIRSSDPGFDEAKLMSPLPELLRLTPLLRKIKISPNLKNYIDGFFLRLLFCDLRFVESVDLSECSSLNLPWDFLEISREPDFKITNSIIHLSLHGCQNIPSTVFKVLLPHLPSIQTLDVANTQITSEALSSLSPSARLKELDVSHCDLLSGADFVEFLSNHASVKSTLISLKAEVTTEQSILSGEDITKILLHTTSTLRLLNLKNSNMNSTHVPYFRRLVSQLEELHIGSQMRLQDIEAVFLNEDAESNQLTDEEPIAVESKYHTVLDSMEEAVSVCKLRYRINSTPLGTVKSKLDTWTSAAFPPLNKEEFALPYYWDHSRFLWKLLRFQRKCMIGIRLFQGFADLWGGM